MGLFGGLLGAIIDTALVPVAVVKDTVNIMEGNDITATTKQLGKVANDLEKSADSAVKGDLL